MENNGIFWPFEIFCDHMEYVCMLWPLVNFVVIWYNSSPFWFVEPRKIWQPWCHHQNAFFLLRHRRYCVVALEKPLAIPIMFLA
jgi:hypothetical protein